MNKTPENEVDVFPNLNQAWPRRLIRCGDKVRQLPPHARSLAGLTFDLGDVRLGVGDYMDRRRTAGVLILKDGEIALERYGMGSGPETLWTSFSTAKSITATLCGAALHDGAIASLDDRCDLYLPQLWGSAYEGVTIRNVLRMCSGVAWKEEEDEPRSGESAAWRNHGLAVQLAARREAGCRLQLLDGRELPARCVGRGRHGPDAGRLLRRNDLGTGRHGGRGALAPRMR
jgi:CubicO group peptidase (beta-lactamase class C family)